MSSLKRNLSDDDEDDHLSDDSPDKKKRQKSFETIRNELKREFSGSTKTSHTGSNLSDDEDTAPKMKKEAKEAPVPTTSKFDPMKMLVMRFNC